MHLLVEWINLSETCGQAVEILHKIFPNPGLELATSQKHQDYCFFSRESQLKPQLGWE